MKSKALFSFSTCGSVNEGKSIPRISRISAGYSPYTIGSRNLQQINFFIKSTLSYRVYYYSMYVCACVLMCMEQKEMCLMMSTSSYRKTEPSQPLTCLLRNC